MKNAKKDIYQRINDKVIEGLKTQGLNWFKPWKTGASNMPFNYVKKTFYKGLNVFLLNAIMVENSYSHNQWLTYKQCKAKGGQVRKGQKSTEVVFWKIGYFDVKTKKYVKDASKVNLSEQYEGKDRYKKTFTLRHFNVFNVAQCDDIEPIKTESDDTEIVHEPNDYADEIVSNYFDSQKSLKLTHVESKAYYHRGLDVVNMPKVETFVDSDSYYKTLFHEMAHSTGHQSRLKRSTLLEVNKWGDTTYAKEELIAEISAMYLVGIVGLNPNDTTTNSQAYIQGWCKHLADKPKECVSAMGQATKVVDFILG